MDNDEIQNIGVKKETLKEANKVHYECRPNDWQMFEILVAFCKDCPDDFENWKKEKFEDIQKKWEKKSRKSKR